MATTLPAEAAALRDGQRANWDRAAPGWHRRAVDGGAADTSVTDRLLALAGIGPGMRVLDLACGVGDPALTIAARVGPTGSVLGLDLSLRMLEGARALARERGIGNVGFRRIDSELELGVPDHSFDAATCRFGMMFMPDPTAALATLRRALRPGRRAAICTWGPPERVPLFTLPWEVLRRHVDVPPFDPAAPGPMRLPKPDLLERFFRDAGFVDAETATVDAIAVATETPEAYWEAQTAMAGSTLGMVATLPEATRQAIRDDMIRTLRAMFPDGPVRLGGEVIVAAGVNPG